MNTTASLSTPIPVQRREGSKPPPVTGRPAMWLPPDRLRQYQRNKVVGGLLVSVIFIGWLVLQWSNPTMRVLAICLIGVTCWVVIRSMLDDARRHRGRQITIINSVLHATTPMGVTEIRLVEVASAQWRQDDQPGLWFYDEHRQPIAHLDTIFLADQAQARNFLGWARQHADLPFKVHWPRTIDSIELNKPNKAPSDEQRSR